MLTPFPITSVLGVNGGHRRRHPSPRDLSVPLETATVRHLVTFVQTSIRTPNRPVATDSLRPFLGHRRR